MKKWRDRWSTRGGVEHWRRGGALEEGRKERRWKGRKEKRE